MAGRYADADRVIVKVGTGFLFDQSDKGYTFLGEQMEALAEELVAMAEEREIALVSSGAIASAVCDMHVPLPKNKYERAQLAGRGQPLLMQLYMEAFRRAGGACAQLLVDSDDLLDRRRRRNLRAVQDAYFRDDVIGIYNENDTLSTEEITFGDNDILAANLAVCLDADLLVMLSNSVEGLGTGGGTSKQKARRILKPHDIAMKIINGRYKKAEGQSFESSPAGVKERDYDWMPKITSLF